MDASPVIHYPDAPRHDPIPGGPIRLALAGALAYGVVIGWLLVLVALRRGRPDARTAVLVTIAGAVLLALPRALLDGAATAAAAVAILPGGISHFLFLAVVRRRLRGASRPPH